MRPFALAALLCLATFAQAVTATFTPKGRGDEAPAIQKLYDTLVSFGGGELYLDNPPPDKWCELDSPILVAPNMLSINTIGRGLRWDAYRYGGKGSCFTFMGLKNSRFVGVTLLLTTPNTIGFDFAGDKDHQSQSEITLEHCRVQGLQNCTGLRIGNTGNDHSDYVIDRCSFYSSADFTNSDVAGSCARVHAYGFRGVEILGGNTLNIAFTRTSVSGADVAFAHQGRAGENGNGGSGTSYEGCGGSFNALVWLFDGYMPHRITGGRWEDGAGLLLQGARLSAGQGTGRLTLEDVMVDSYDARANKSLGFVDDGVLIGMHSNGSLRMDNLNGYGNQVDPSRWIGCRSNSGAGPVLAVGRSIFGAASVRPVEGQLGVVSQ